MTAGQKELQGLKAAGLVTPQLTPKKGATGSHHSGLALPVPLSQAGWGGSWSPISVRAAKGGRRQSSLIYSFTGYLLSTYYKQT